MKLVFKAIKKDSIFEPEYQNLSSDNGTVEFKHMNSRGGIAVVYAPNGTGKSSLAKVLEAEESNDSMSFVATDDSGKAIIPEAKAFFVIPDQINRNVIRGKETDYFIGQQIRREYELRDRINTMFDMAFTSLGQKYKSDYGVSKVGDYILTQIGSVPDESYSTAFAFIRSIVNARQHGKDIDQRAFIDYIRNEYNKPTLVSLNDEMKKWIITDVSKEKITEHLINLDYHAITPNVETVQIEQHDDAINILKKYHSAESCIVCDNPNFDGDVLLARKTETRKRMYDELDQHTKTLLDKVVKDSSLVASDPFDIKRIVSDFIAGGESAELQQLQVTLSIYVRGIGDEMVDALFHCFDGTDMIRDFDEFVQLTEGQPVLDSEEILFIEEIINESIGKDITIVRDQDSRNYKLKLGEKDLIGVNREEMELSSGEQNFISLAFELLLARHSAKEYVVLDDPISSFDSVYKNKIAYCIVKFLEDKKQLVLTHNTDLIRLLEVQLNNCFNLYILNNVENGHNGFIPIEEKEKKLLINLHELIKFFQNKDGRLVSVIHNRRFFMMAMVPFMRGYAHINLDSNDYFGRLSDIMHGYGTGNIDTIPIYKELFGYEFDGEEIISVDDVLNIDCDNLDIIDKVEYPLLSETLRQTLIYYHLRMKVEKELVNAFSLQTRDMDTLNQIIRRAFNCREDDPDAELKRDYRVFFTSRKTLLNEFNHFEGNINIFQPAIDINPDTLKKEIRGIESKLSEVWHLARHQSMTES